MTGVRAVELVRENVTPSKLLTRQAFENAIMINAALGGSTNFILHLTAIAGRVGVELSLDDFDRLSAKIPLLANLQPSGEHFVEDLFYAGGLPAIIRELQPYLHNDALTVNGRTIGDNCVNAQCYDPAVIASVDKPFKPESGVAVLRGNLCPNGAVLKPSAASPSLMQHTGRAVVFENIDDYKVRIDDPELDVDPSCVLVLKNVGPKGYPGMPEVGNMQLPAKILALGVHDMVRISDGRMSGTGFGTVVLHVSPEAAVGGNLALVQNGDMITLDVENRSLHLHVSDEELAGRLVQFKPLDLGYSRGYVNLYIRHVTQAHEGADFDFLKGGSGSVVKRDSH
jgi:dihydroxy-acid dehydratase